MKKNIGFFVSALVLLVVVSLIIVSYNKQKTQSYPVENSVMENQPAEAQQPAKTVDVTAQNNTFSPNIFNVKQSETLHLRVNALDKDYQFKVEGYNRLNTTFSKGSVKTYTIDKLGVGEYPYTCGTDCKGTIVIEQEED